MYFDSNFAKIRYYGLTDNRSAFVQLMAWRRTGDKPLPEPVMTQLFYADMCG